MTNPYRGEVSVNIDGKTYEMRLTLGVLAELEAELESDGLMDLVQRFETGKFSARDLISLLSAGLRGAGNQFPEPNVDGGPIAAARAAAQLLAVTFSVPD